MGSKNKQRTILGARLRRLRRLYGLTQQEVAKHLHMERSTYAYYEADKTEPDLHTLDRIATLFRVSTDFLLGRKGDCSVEDIFQYIAPNLSHTNGNSDKEAPPDP